MRKEKSDWSVGEVIKLDEGGFDKLRITHIDGPSGYYVGRVCLRDCEVERIK